MVWTEFECETSLIAKTPENASTLLVFFQCGVHRVLIQSDRGTVKPRREALDIDNLVLLLRLCGAGSNCGERAKTRQGQKNAGQDYKQAD